MLGLFLLPLPLLLPLRLTRELLAQLVANRLQVLRDRLNILVLHEVVRAPLGQQSQRLPSPVRLAGQVVLPLHLVRRVHLLDRLIEEVAQRGQEEPTRVLARLQVGVVDVAQARDIRLVKSEFACALSKEVGGGGLLTLWRVGAGDWLLLYVVRAAFVLPLVPDGLALQQVLGTLGKACAGWGCVPEKVVALFERRAAPGGLLVSQDLRGCLELDLGGEVLEENEELDEDLTSEVVVIELQVQELRIC